MDFPFSRFNMMVEMVDVSTEVADRTLWKKEIWGDISLSKEIPQSLRI